MSLNGVRLKINQREGLTLPPGQKLLEGTGQGKLGMTVQTPVLQVFFLSKIINKGGGGGRGGSAPAPAHPWF